MRSDRELWKYLDGESTPDEASAVRAELERDTALQGRLAELEALRTNVTSGVPAPPEGFADKVTAMAALATPVPVLDLDEARRFVRRALVAAALLGAVGLAYLAFGLLPDLMDAAQPLQASPLLGGK
ncbi:MAG: anti-sigma factor family protein [Planctomycetota bacterium]|jgi:anti-sigma factor RsiW